MYLYILYIYYITKYGLYNIHVVYITTIFHVTNMSYMLNYQSVREPPGRKMRKKKAECVIMFLPLQIWHFPLVGRTRVLISTPQVVCPSKLGHVATITV